MKPTLSAPGTKRLKQNVISAVKFCLQLQLAPLHSAHAEPARRRAGCGVATHEHAFHGRAVQVDPIKPTLKAPGTNRLQLEYEKLL